MWFDLNDYRTKGRGMEWFVSAEKGAWLREHVVGFGKFYAMLPPVFESYAKVLPPVTADRIEGVDQWGLPLRVEQAEWRWAEVARRTGKTLTSSLDWQDLVSSGRGEGASWADGWAVSAPEEGFIHPAHLAELVRQAARFTTTPEDITIAIWDGWGFSESGSFAYIGVSDNDEVSEMAPRDYWKAERNATDPQLRRMDEIQRGAFEEARATGKVSPLPGELLDLPDRSYVLASTNADTLSDPDWIFDSGLGWVRDGFAGPTPQLIWPADHTWCIATEIDSTATYVGGSRELIRAIVQSSAIEALPADANER